MHYLELVALIGQWNGPLPRFISSDSKLRWMEVILIEYAAVTLSCSTWCQMAEEPKIALSFCGHGRY